MELSELTLSHFRNYDEAHLTFQPGVNVFLGQNAQGKTNLLESIYALALARSHRTKVDKDLIQWGQDQARVAGIIVSRFGKTPLSLTWSKKGKQARVNHLDQSRLSSYIGQLNVILFAPEDLDLVKGAPAVRRRFIDIEFGQMNRTYLQLSAQYRKVLRDRNAYLKAWSFGGKKDAVFLSVLTEQLIELASKLILLKKRFLTELEQAAARIHRQVANQQEELVIQYKTAVNVQEISDEETLKQALTLAFEKHADREKKQGTTLVGPHRDDFVIEVNGVDVSNFGSQGQQRTAALALKLGEIDLMHEETGEYPILLLDDVLSELDASRQTHLLMTIEDKVQTFITAPSLSEVARSLIKEPKIFLVKDGTIQVEESKEQEENHG
ncbi:DNA replication/repair protein RecF [Fructobacillus fructosus]|uniref:DNA replication and repair protein RecF n=1 Tax=Fructobacillus fructosus TaxID=1631 RepID=A0ABM9MP59_9LACO|nr:DNA replication/repair protein RecF [Fructobacillus fructosus]MBD9365448.1 DNA replication/repair protein RecF [Leuconostoc mesenteroides]MCK8637851.1 DNA replication/repair protein RecF [Fructobacillus fructosus]CAK1230218.1 Recombinational DNA repair ATPase RecF (RecF) [Fructobacillus fructosus]CAK1233539.1 Recombinational DNA repair ATPase RecF (RecF) [Fructobacillus fructosus]